MVEISINRWKGFLKKPLKSSGSVIFTIIPKLLIILSATHIRSTDDDQRWSPPQLQTADKRPQLSPIYHHSHSHHHHHRHLVISK